MRAGLLFLVLGLFFALATSEVKENTSDFSWDWPWDKFFDMMAEMMDDMTEIIISGMQETDDLLSAGMEEISSTILTLADDIGDMADRIGEMADRIGDMALQIGIMADRIVQTEILMADIILVLSGNSNSTIPIPPVGQNYSAISDPIYNPLLPVVIISPQDTDTLSMEMDIKCNVPTESSALILYASTDAEMAEQRSTSIYVANDEKLPGAWERVMNSYCAKENEVFVAIRLLSTENGSLSGLSNSVQLYC